MSRLLFLLPSEPEPLDAGARIRNQGLMKLLAADHEVDAIAFGRSGSQSLGRVAQRWTTVTQPAPRHPVRRAMDLAGTTLPDMARRLWSPTFMDAVRSFTSERRYDAVQAEGIEMARYLHAVPPAQRIYDAHNAEFLLQRRLGELPGPLATRLYSRLQWRRLERFERAIVRGSRLTLAVSQHDANQLLALAGHGADVRVISNGIDTTNYAFDLPREDDPPNLLFLGKLDFRPNADGLAWFIQDVLPRVPQVRLFAVGAAPPSWLVRAGQHDDRVAVTGYVADERPYLARSSALVLPVRTGGGSRLKALIAMASGLPILSTRVGMEGLDAEPDTHFLAADTAADWVAALHRLLGDAALRQRLARCGRRLVEARYDWSAIRAEVRAAYSWFDR